MLQGISLLWSCSSNMFATCYKQLAQSVWPRWKSAHEWASWIWIQERHCTCEIAIHTPTPPHSVSLSPSIALPPHLLCGCVLSPSLRRSVYKVKAALKWLSLWFILFFYINTASCDLRPVVGGWRERGRTHMHLHTLLDSLIYYLVWVTSVSCCRMCHHQCDNFCFARGWNICFFLCYVCLWRWFFAVSTVSSSFVCFDQDCNR